MTNDPQCPEQGGNARPDTGGTTDAKTHEQTDKEGETDSEVKEAECGKEMGKTDAGKVTEKHSPASSTEPVCEQNINNDPNYQKGESTSPGKVDGKNKKTEASVEVTSKGFRKVASMNRQEKIMLLAHSLPNKDWPKEYVEAMVGIKLANLTEKEKAFLVSFWKTMYPDTYVQEMVADR